MAGTLTETIHINALFEPDFAECAGDPDAAGQIFPPKSAKFLPRVLVVDEEHLVRWSLCEMLTAAGCQVVGAQNRGEAHAAMADEDHPIDVMLVDVTLPGAEGLLLVREARRRCLTCPVIVMTAYGSADTLDAALSAGADHVIVKPFDLDDLLRLVRQVCPAAAH